MSVSLQDRDWRINPLNFGYAVVVKGVRDGKRYTQYYKPHLMLTLYADRTADLLATFGLIEISVKGFTWPHPLFHDWEARMTRMLVLLRGGKEEDVEV